MLNSTRLYSVIEYIRYAVCRMSGNIMLSMACCAVDFYCYYVLCTVTTLLCITCNVHAVSQSRAQVVAAIGQSYVATNLVV